MQTVIDYLSIYTNTRTSSRAIRTIKAEQSYIRLYCQSLTMPICLLRKKHIAGIIDQIIRTGHVRTAQAVYTYLRSAAKGNKHFAAIMSAITRPEHTPKDITYLSPDEAKRLIVYSAPQWSAVWLLMITLGLRRGEVCGLRWTDIDYERNLIHIRNQRQYITGIGIVDSPPKSDSGNRTLPLTEPVIAALDALLAVHEAESIIGSASPYVFKGACAGGLHPSSIDHALRRETRNLGIRHVTVHGLRHTFATHSVSAGGNIRVLSDMLGHASITTTSKVYAHVDMTPKHVLCNAVIGILDTASSSTQRGRSI